MPRYNRYEWLDNLAQVAFGICVGVALVSMVSLLLLWASRAMQ